MESKMRTVVVAGGTGALGASVSRAFIAAGARVIATYVKQTEYDALSKQVGAELIGVPLDVTDEAAVAKFVAETESKNGAIDALVIAVGGYVGGKQLWETDTATYNFMLSLIRQNRGAVVNVASKSGYGHSAGAAMYAASKAGVMALFSSLAEEVKPYNINVNSVVPSIMDTPANRREMPKADFNIWPKTDDIAKVIVYLCSDEARVIHGAEVPVYGKT
jgi:NAD(P)-dependent dehydrogenase (short-subunit alcohol dehydrogenase family)